MKTRPTTKFGRLLRDDRGSAGGEAIELVMFAPIAIMLILVIVAAGRLSVGSGRVDQAAAAAARAASQQNNATTAQTAAEGQAAKSLAGSGVSCQNMTVTIDTSGFSAPIGVPANVNVQVACTASLSDLAIPGLPGSKTLTGSAASPLDIHQERG